MGQVKRPAQRPCACTHTIRTLADAIKELQIELGLPDFCARSGYRQLFVEYKEFSNGLIRYFRDRQARDDHHAVAAVCTVWARMTSDAGIASKMRCDVEYGQCVVAAVRPCACELRLVCGLHLVANLSDGYGGDARHGLTHRLLHPVLDALPKTRPDGLAWRLCLEAFYRTLYDVTRPEKTEAILTRREASRLLEKSTDLAGVVGRDTFFQLFHIYLELFISGQLEYPPDISQKYGYFLLGLLRYGSAVYRRLAFNLLTGVQDQNPRKRRSPTEPCECCRTGGHSHGAEKPKEARMRMPGTHPLPADLDAAMTSFGVEDCESTQIRSQMLACRDIMRDLAATGDLATAGLRLYLQILANPLAIRFEPEGETLVEFGATRPRDCGLAFDEWTDTLLFAANAVRKLSQEDIDASSSAEDLLSSRRTAAYIALVLECHHLLTARSDEVLDLLKVARGDYPDDPYLLYAALEAEDFDLGPEFYEGKAEDVVRDIRKSADATDGGTVLGRLIRATLARKAFCYVNSAVCCRMSVFWGPHLDLADDMAREYLAVCPPDGIDRCWMLEIRIFARIIRYGPDVSPTLLDIMDMLLDWRQAEQFSSALYDCMHTLHLSDVLRFILDHQSDALAWEGRLRAYCPEAGFAEYAGRTSWLVPIPSNDRAAARAWMLRVRSPHDAVDWDSMPDAVLRLVAVPQAALKRMPTCNACGRRSASLKKCAGCHTATYCNADCQWRDWTGKACPRGAATPVPPHREECSRKYPFRGAGPASSPGICFDC